MAGKYTDAQKKASLKYAKNALKRVPLDMQKTEYEKLAEAAQAAGMSVNGYIKQAISEKMQRENPG